jgi:hypothetical protein
MHSENIQETFSCGGPSGVRCELMTGTASVISELCSEIVILPDPLTPQKVTFGGHSLQIWKITAYMYIEKLVLHSQQVSS